MEGLLRAYQGQITVCNFFDGGLQRYDNGVHTYYTPSKELRDEMAEFFVCKTWASNRAKKIRAIKENRGCDFSYFQCFCFERYGGKWYVGNSLNGDAYDYCKRCFSNRIF